MELNVDFLNMSSEEIYNELLPFIQSILDSYSTQINKSDIETIAFDTIEEYKYSVTKDSDVLKEFKKKLLSNLKLFLTLDIRSDDIVGMYLKEIGQYRLLKPEQEIEEIIKIQNGDLEARENFIKSNLRFAVYWAKKYLGNGLDLLDLVQEANLGLMKAVDRFSLEKGVKFSTYAYWWIRQAITRALANNGRQVRLPVYLYEKVKKYERTHDILARQLSREPTLDEIAKEMNLPIIKVEELSIYAMNNITSMNQLVGEDTDSEYGDFIPSEEETPEEQAISKQLSDLLHKAKDSCSFTKREKYVLDKRYPLDGGEIIPLEEIGTKFNLTRERIRQLETKALRKIRNSKYKDSLNDYVHDGSDGSHSTFQDQDGNKITLKVDRRLPNDIVVYLYHCGLTEEEITEVCIVSGLPDKELKTVAQISLMLNIKAPELRTKVIQALEKLSLDYDGMPFFKYIIKMYSENKKNVYLKLINEYIQKLLNGKTIEIEEEPTEVKKPKRLITPKVTSIYVYFEDYSKDEVKAAITTLSEDDQELVRFRFGPDIDNPTPSPITTAQYNRIYSFIIPRLRRELILLRNDNKLLDSINKEGFEGIMNEIDDSNQAELYPVITYIESAIASLNFGLSRSDIHDEYIKNLYTKSINEVQLILLKELLLYSLQVNSFVAKTGRKIELKK